MGGTAEAAGGAVAPHLVALLRGRVGSGATAATTEDDTASYTGTAVTLQAHLRGVADRARCFAQRCALPTDIAKDVALAAELHDLGKADPRFQCMLHGGSSYRAQTAPELLAKSAMPAGDRSAREQARLRAGYPRGGGHELLSTALLEQSEQWRALAGDSELLLHLVASHHGACRPLAPHIEDPNPVLVDIEHGEIRTRVTTAHALARLDSGVVDRFWELNNEYGWYGLAWLETLVRLADHRQSELEQQVGGRRD
jgi:CRISPR-associated endonuclease/helicase Cas3